MIPLRDPVQGSSNLSVQSQSSVSSLTQQGRHVCWAWCRPLSVQSRTSLSVSLCLSVSLWSPRSVVTLSSLNRSAHDSRPPRTTVDRSISSSVACLMHACVDRVWCLLFVVHALAWGGWRWMPLLGHCPAVMAHCGVPLVVPNLVVRATVAPLLGAFPAVTVLLPLPGGCPPVRAPVPPLGESPVARARVCAHLRCSSRHVGSGACSETVMHSAGAHSQSAAGAQPAR